MEEIKDDKDKNVSLKDAGIYFFMDDVTNCSMKSVIEWILEENIK